MKTLSIKQPYATLCASGVKDVENRSWSTKYRGRLWIHASTWSNDRNLFDKALPLRVFQEFDRCVDSDGNQNRKSKMIEVKKNRLYYIGPEKYRHEFELLKTEMARQIDDESTLFAEHAIVGVVDLLDIVQNSKSAWSNDGSYHWIFGNAVLLDRPTLGIKGRLRIWNSDAILDDSSISYVKR